MALAVFVSHSVNDTDQPAVDKISASLTGARVENYVAKYDRQAGVPLSSKVKDHIDGSTILLAVITKEGHDSAYVREEIGYALARKRDGGLDRVIAFVEADGWEGAMLAGVEQIPFDPSNAAKDVEVVTEYIARLKAERELGETRKRLHESESAQGAELAIIAVLCVALVLVAVLAARK